jgi:hypothetical protein
MKIFTTALSLFFFPALLPAQDRPTLVIGPGSPPHLRPELLPHWQKHALIVDGAVSPKRCHTALRWSVRLSAWRG